MGETKKFPKLFESGQIANVRIKNRIVMPAMGTSFWGPKGDVTERITDHYAARAKGGAGLIVVSFATPDYPSGYMVQASLESEEMVAGHARLVERLHGDGAKVALQINHSGRSLWKKVDIVSSSPVRCVSIRGEPFGLPRALEKDEIREIVNRFGIIGANAKRAGYDLVEVHGAHGYLVNSFMSPYLNTRLDEFGGSLENRMRFPIEIIRRIKETAGDDFPVGIRVSGDEFVEGGVTPKESPDMARMLEEAGAAFIDVSGGIEEVKHKQIDIMRFPEGWKAYIWEAIKRAVHVPIVASGGHRTPEYCERVIAEGKADFVALGRQLFADPEWPSKVREGLSEDIRKCISCNECQGFRTGRATETHCAVNVAVGREKEFGEIKPADVKRRVVVVGGGPAGMEASRIARLRGHEVTVYDQKETLGGNLLLAAVPPGKEKLLWFRDYEATQLSKLKVILKIGVKATPELIEETNPDVVILAAGSKPLIPEIPGAQKRNVFTAWDVLEGKAKLTGQKVVVVGGGTVGAETAEFLRNQDNRVTLVEMLPGIAEDMEPLNRRGLMDGLRDKNVTVLTEHRVEEITDQGVVVTSKQNMERGFVEADWVILAMGSKAAQELADALEKKIPHLYVIGDCRQPRTILAAVYEGALTALKI